MVVVFGRHRVGKTILTNQTFNNFDFYLTSLCHLLKILAKALSE